MVFHSIWCIPISNFFKMWALMGVSVSFCKWAFDRFVSYWVWRVWGEREELSSWSGEIGGYCMWPPSIPPHKLLPPVWVCWENKSGGDEREAWGCYCGWEECLRRKTVANAVNIRVNRASLKMGHVQRLSVFLFNWQLSLFAACLEEIRVHNLLFKQLVNIFNFISM